MGSVIRGCKLGSIKERTVKWTVVERAMELAVLQGGLWRDIIGRAVQKNSVIERTVGDIIGRTVQKNRVIERTVGDNIGRAVQKNSVIERTVGDIIGRAVQKNSVIERTVEWAVQGGL